MSDTLSEEVKQQIVISAATVAGANATADEVSKQVERIAGYLNPNSPVQRAFANLDKRASQTVKSAGFVATIIGFGKEESSNRGIVMFHSSVTTHTPEAKEFLRTEILDGGPVSALMNSVKELTGHKVNVQFDLVKKNDSSGHTVRVLTGIKPIGPDPDYDFDKPEYQPVFYTDTAKAQSMAKNTFFPRVPVAA